MENPHLIAKQEIVFVRLLAPFSLGILVFYGYKLSGFEQYLIALTTVLFIYLCIRNRSVKPTNIRLNKGWNGLLGHVLLFLIGALSSTLYNSHNHSDYYAFKKSDYLKISISDEPVNRQNLILFVADVTYYTTKDHLLKPISSGNRLFEHASGKIKVSLLKKDPFSTTLKYGDELLIPARFVEVAPALNPAAFDYKKWLATQNIYHQTILKQEEVVQLHTNRGNRIRRFALSLRAGQVGLFRRIIKDDDAFAVAATLILGYRADLNPEIFDIYAKTGTIHALSVSGMHVGLLYLVLNRMLWFLGNKQGLRFIKTIAILFFIWCYTLLTGFSPSALRACIMISVYILAKLFNRNTNSYNIIAFTAFCLLLYNPFFIWDVGFQLSFIAVLGLIYLQPKIQNSIPLKNPWLANLWGIVAMSISAQLATYPLSVYYFHQFPVYFLLSNLFLTLPAILIMYIGLIILLFRLEALGPFFEWLINFSNSGLGIIARLPFAGVNAIWLTKPELLLLSSALLLLIMAWDRREKGLLKISILLWLGLQSSISYHKLQSFHQKKIIQFTLKRNYAVASISAHRAIVVTDLTQKSKAFQLSVKPALDQHRVTRITFLQTNVTSD